MQDKEQKKIKKLIEKAYIKGIHEEQDAKIVKSGFHQEFAMLVFKEDAIEKVNVDQWFDRIDKMKRETPELWKMKTTHTFSFIDVSGNAAATKLNVYKGKTHFSTDYMLLYKFKEGWKIVSKVFTIPK
jgi:hypothetical protein